MKRYFALILLILSLTISVIAPAVASNPVIQLDAAALPEGPVYSWKSTGTLGGSFDVIPVGGGVVEQVGGRKAVTFDGRSSRFVSSFASPDSITGKSSYTVAVWVFNPTIEAEESLVCWAPRNAGDGKTAQLNYGSSPNFGAVAHWGKGDMGFDGGLPKAGEWHFIAVTYGDGLENVYVDGKLNAREKKGLDTAQGAPIYIGSAGLEKLFSGSISSIQVYSKAASASEIASLYDGKAELDTKPLIDLSAKDLPEGALTAWKNSGTLGGSFDQVKYAPAVETIGDRKAVAFSNGGWLQSGLNLPTAPFTIEIWTQAIKDGAQAGTPTSALSVGGIAKDESLRIGLSREGKAGALTCGKTAVGFKKSPALKAWHQIAYVYDKDNTLRVYVDGDLDSEQKCGLSLPTASPINLGAAWLKDKGIPYAGFDGAISKLCVYDSALSQLEIRTHNGMQNAFNPTPASNSTVDTLETTLFWEVGNPAAKTCQIYCSTDAESLEDASSAIFKGKVSATNPKSTPIKLEIGKNYYWRVDQISADGKLLDKGDVWQFATDSGKATDSAPRNQISAVPVNTSTLSWTPGKFATDQTIYFGTKETWDNPLKAKLSKDAHEFKLPTKLDYGKNYIWRIDSNNGTSPATTGDIWSFRTEDKLTDTDVTFFAISDLHNSGPDSHRANQDLIRIMNCFPGTAYPAEVGGNVATPRGILATGDITNNGKQIEWDAFLADYGLNCSASLAYPIYELWGNHDGRTTGVVAQGIKERNLTRKGLTAVSKNGFHYSWDWGKVHFINANIYPAQTSKIVIADDPINSLEFLKDDLAKNVGKSGRPVVIEMHYGLDGGGAGWWTKDEQDAFYNAIKDYNVVAMLFGHTHGGGLYKWNGIDMINVGASLNAETARQFVVFHITDKELVAARRYPDRWDKVLKKPITGMDTK